jgi:hypothetical protein
MAGGCGHGHEWSGSGAGVDLVGRPHFLTECFEIPPSVMIDSVLIP